MRTVAPDLRGTLRKRLHVGTPTARRLVTQLRSDTHTKIEASPAWSMTRPSKPRD
jgi:hypothetical protein